MCIDAVEEGTHLLKRYILVDSRGISDYLGGQDGEYCTLVCFVLRTFSKVWTHSLQVSASIGRS